MAKRINVVLEDETAHTIRHAAKPGERSRFINRAVQYYAATQGPEALRERLRQAALRDQDLGGKIARDWFAVDREPWQTARAVTGATKRTRGAAKSTS